MECSIRVPRSILISAPRKVDAKRTSAGTVGWTAQFRYHGDTLRPRRAEYEGKSFLLGSGVHLSVLHASIDRLLHCSESYRLTLSTLKVLHHGGKANTTVELRRKVCSSNVLFSMSGRGFGHPDAEAVARVTTASLSPL